MKRLQPLVKGSGEEAVAARINATQALLEKEETGDLLLSSRGLQVRRRANGFVAVRLHYSADPEKEEKWAAMTKAAMNNVPQFEREFELNFDAVSGTPVFGMLDDSIHIKPLADSPPPGATSFTGTDSGYDKPASTLWVYLDDKGKYPDHFTYRENYISRMSAPNYAKMTLGQCAKETYAGQWGDPSIWNETQGAPVSVGQQFASAGFRISPALGRDDFTAVQMTAFMLGNSIIRARGGEPPGPCL